MILAPSLGARGLRAMCRRLGIVSEDLATIEADEDGQLIVGLRDVPEALTSGETLEEALAEAADCLVVALDGYLDERRPRAVPRPSRSRAGEHAIAVPPLVAAKLALHDAMRGGALTPAVLAERLGISEPAARRLLDLGHRSRIEDVQAALAKLGKRIEVTVSAA